MASFTEAVEITLVHEGGYQNNPADKGNYTTSGKLIGTNYGISAKTLEAWLKYEPTESIMRALPRTSAIKIYQSMYWNPYKLSEIANQQIANQLFDIGVLQGPGVMADIAQDALNNIGYSIVNDKAFGPLTRAAINKAISEGQTARLNAELVKIRSGRLASNTWTGWVARAESYLQSIYSEASKKKV